MSALPPAVSVAASIPVEGGREFWTPDEMAAHLDTTPTALACLRTRGGGPPFIHVGRAVRYPVVAVRLWALQRAHIQTRSEP